MHMINKSSAVACLLAGLATHTAACEMEHSLRYKIDSGAHVVRLNGVLIDYGIAHSGFMRLTKGIVNGENTLSISFETPNGAGAAQYSILKGCKGGLPNETPVGELAFAGEDTKEIRFTSANVQSEVYPNAQVTDGTGLREAVQVLQNAVRDRDTRSVFAMHGPLFSNMKAEGRPMPQINAHVRKMIRKGQISISETFDMNPVFGGQAWEVRAASDAPPVSISLDADGGTYEWYTGTLWVFADGEWSVLEP